MGPGLSARGSQGVVAAVPAHSHRPGASCCPRLLGARGHPGCALPLSLLREWPQPAPPMLSELGDNFPGSIVLLGNGDCILKAPEVQWWLQSV